MVEIRGGARRIELSSIAALTTYLDVELTMQSIGRLAQAVADATTLEEANQALHLLGVRTELDLETDAAKVGSPDDL